MRLAEKSDDLVVALKQVKARGTKGVMRLRTMKPEQLSRMFADSPQGGGNKEAPVPKGVELSRLHRIMDKELESFIAVPAEVDLLME
ncbi:MAG: hypothetical protein EXS25_00010 [Pedosphaera sp.]|nr:hypothetical protein [Pedosphaera sp.]